MATDEEIRVVYKNVDEVIGKLRSLAESAEGVAKADYALSTTMGSGGTALVSVGTATNDFARKLSALIRRTADRVEHAKGEYEGADFEAASGIARIGVKHSGGGAAGVAGGGGGSTW